MQQESPVHICCPILELHRCQHLVEISELHLFIYEWLQWIDLIWFKGRELLFVQARVKATCQTQNPKKEMHVTCGYHWHQISVYSL